MVVGVIEGGYVYLVYEFNVHIQTSGAIYVCVCVFLCGVSGRKLK